jgi:glycerophosphoryl diester phosphodiesterase
MSLFLLSSPGQEVPAKQKPFKYVAHRGASYLAPENTLASIQLAWELEADAAECDVMLSSDNKVLLFHDKNTKKLCGQSHVVSETPWEILDNLEVKLRNSNLPEYKGETIPLLSEVLPTIPENRMLVIEIKTGPEILPYLKEVVEPYQNSGKISFIAFDFETIAGAKALFPQVPAYYLSSFQANINRNFEAILSNKLDGVDLRHSIINNSLMQKCTDAGLEVWCWTVNDPETALKMKDLGVTAITTDRPRWLKEQIATQN